MTSLTYQAAKLAARIDATKKLVKVAASGNREAYSYYREGADLWEKPKQKYSSSETSINSKKLPSVFSKIVKEKDWHKGINIDIGGGKFDNVDQWMQENGYGRNLVFDPFNRSEQHNRSVVDTIKKNGGG